LRKISKIILGNLVEVTMISDELLKILICPKCKGPIEYITKPEEKIICRACKLVYEVKNNIPVMLPDEAKPM
jgi:uncharacterized protein YbaR (Trm112 family)